MSTATPWFPADPPPTSDPCVVTTGSRSNNSMSLFAPWRSGAPRDADHYEMEPQPSALPLDALELQDDSFVNFSVGNLDRRNFSVLGVGRYVRPGTGLRTGGGSPERSGGTSSAADSDGSSDRGGWRRRRSKRRRRGVLCFRP